MAHMQYEHHQTVDLRLQKAISKWFYGYPLVSSNPGPLMHLQVTHFPAWHWAIQKLEQLAKAQVPPVKPQSGDCCSCPKHVAYVGKPKLKTFC